ncbi:ABC transporter B family member 15 isoform X1 [Spatholobus suberectus]|nr:ABC transporter B family member 15 isoform X1 [Spatholobus suberectus]
MGTIVVVGEGLATLLVLCFNSRVVNNIGSSFNMEGNTFVYNINKVQFHLSFPLNT